MSKELNNTFFIHSYTTAAEKELGEIQKMCSAMETASAGFKKMSAKNIEGKVCPHCQEWYSVLKEGAKDEMVMTKTGSIMVVTSDKTKTVEKIHVMADKMRQMFAGAGAEKM